MKSCKVSFIHLRNTSILMKDKLLLSIGGGMGGLEVIINENCEVNFFDFIERNFVSKKVVYGWSE